MAESAGCRADLRGYGSWPAGAAGCLSAPLMLERLDTGYGRVTACGGVFEAGTLRLTWLDAHRQTLAVQSLGTVDPLSLVKIDQITRIPPQAATLALDLVADSKPLRLAELPLG